MEDSRDRREMCKEVDDVESSASNDKGSTSRPPATVGTLVEDDERRATKIDDDDDDDDKFEESEREISLRKTDLSVGDSAMPPETARDDDPTSSNDAESSSPSCFGDRNKCKRSISKARANGGGGDSCDDGNRCSSDDQSSKRRKSNENVSNESKRENKSADEARTSKEPVTDDGLRDERFVQDVETTSADLFLDGSLASNRSRSGATEHAASEEESAPRAADSSACLKKKVPKPGWYVVPELVRRETGMNPLFPRRCYGSLHVVERLRLTYELREHEGCVNALNFNEAGNLLASGSDDLNVVVWDWARGRRRANLFSQHRSNVYQVKWMYHAEHLVATCAGDGQVRLLDATGGTSRRLATHYAPTRRLALHPDTPDIVISAGEDARVLSIDVRESRPTELLVVVKNGSDRLRLYSVHSNPLSSNEFCVSGQFQFVKVYDRRNASVPIHELCPEHLTENKNVQVTCASYNYNGTEILASYNDEDIYLFDTASSPRPGGFARKYEGHRNSATVKGVNFFGPKSEYVISGSDSRNIFVWDKNSEAIVNWMFGDENGVVNCLEPHPHVPVLATSGFDCGVKMWVPTEKKRLSFDELKDCVASNARNRSQENSQSETDAIAGQLLRILVRHVRRAERVRSTRISTLRNRTIDDDEEDDDDEGEDDDDDSSDHSDGRSDGDSVRRLRCSPS